MARLILGTNFVPVAEVTGRLITSAQLVNCMFTRPVVGSIGEVGVISDEPSKVVPAVL